MKTILLTQRVVTAYQNKERRDAIDQQWIALLLQAGFIPMLVPNCREWLNQYLSIFPCDGILLTGGNSLVKYGGDAEERDDLERHLVEFAIVQNLPLLGVCRGMQVLQDYFGGALQRVFNHVCEKQQVTINGQETWVNSYHEWGSSQSPSSFENWAVAKDGIIKAIKHKVHSLWGIMWHPERMHPFTKRDIQLLQHIFDEGSKES